jgi:hypothetical protein
MHPRQNLLHDLAAPGRLIVFVDDSATGGKPLPRLAADFEVLCGVPIRGESYQEIREALAAELSAVGAPVEEFHATEIVNPPTRSAWHRVSVPKRVEVLRRLVDVVEANASRIFFCYVSGQQYRTEMVPVLAAAGVKIRHHKKTLYTVFREALIPYLQAESADTAIVADSESPLFGTVKIEKLDAPARIYRGGVIHVDSKDEAGVQLADLVAYLYNRAYHLDQRRRDDKHGPFDEVTLDSIARLWPRFVNVLTLRHEG